MGQSWAGFPPLDGGGLARAAEADQPLIVSRFADAEGRDYAAVVNNSQTASTRATLTFGGGCRLYRVEWGANEAPVNAGAAPGEDVTRIRTWLAPGQMELYRVENQPPIVKP